MTTYQVGDPEPVTEVYHALGTPGWAACLARVPNEPAYIVCQWPAAHPHEQHVAVAGYRVTHVWSDDQP